LVQVIDEKAEFFRLELGEPKPKRLLRLAVTQNRDSMPLSEVEILDFATPFVRPLDAVLGIYLE
jgi:hypothetical protein